MRTVSFFEDTKLTLGGSEFTEIWTLSGVTFSISTKNELSFSVNKVSCVGRNLMPQRYAHETAFADRDRHDVAASISNPAMIFLILSADFSIAAVHLL